MTNKMFDSVCIYDSRGVTILPNYKVHTLFFFAFTPKTKWSIAVSYLREFMHIGNCWMRYLQLLSFFPKMLPQRMDLSFWFGTVFMPDTLPNVTLQVTTLLTANRTMRSTTNSWKHVRVISKFENGVKIH